MNTLRIPSFRRLWPLITAILVIAGVPLFGEPADATPAPATGGKTTAAAPAKNRVYVGMPAEELQALIGKPERIVPVPSKSGKDGHVEIWVYRRLIKTSTEIVQIGTKPIMLKKLNSNGTVTDVIVSYEPVNPNRVTEVYQVANFLIANGQFVTTTQSEEKVQTFH